MASTLKPLHRSTRIRFLCFREHQSPPTVEGPRKPGLGWHPNRGSKDGPGPLLRFPCLPRHHACHPLPPLPLRPQILHPPHRLRLLHQLRPHRPLTMASTSPDSSQPSPSTKTVRLPSSPSSSLTSRMRSFRASLWMIRDCRIWASLQSVSRTSRLLRSRLFNYGFLGH